MTPNPFRAVDQRPNVGNSVLRLPVRTLLLWLLLLVAGFAWAQAQTAPSSPNREAFVGYWYGEDYQVMNRAVTKWLMDRRADGTFRVASEAPLSLHPRQP